MLILALKISVTVFASVLAIMQIYESRSIITSADPDDDKHQTFGGMSFSHWFKILLAIGTLLLLGLSEYLVHKSTVLEKDQANEQITDLEQQLQNTQERLDVSETLLSRILNQTEMLRQRNRDLLHVVERQLVVGPRTLLQMEIVRPRMRLFPLGSAASDLPRKGDIIEWEVDCTGSPLPSLETESSNSCRASDGYGALHAFSQRIILNSETGRRTLYGSSSSDNDMFYLAPSGDCTSIYESLQRRYCRISLTFFRVGESELVAVGDENYRELQLGLDERTQQACDEYRRVTGESCADITSIND